MIILFVLLSEISIPRHIPSIMTSSIALIKVNDKFFLKRGIKVTLTNSMILRISLIERDFLCIE